ncbi:hypothetical protein [Streptomyces sp. Y7]|uniref:hypothetical protein n=1 Tax=Streptomyces sp. Y7 TaxID=3342392 RepID=UPI0037171ECF
MKVATTRGKGRHCAGLVDAGDALQSDARDLRALLSHPDRRARAANAAGHKHEVLALDARSLEAFIGIRDYIVLPVVSRLVTPNTVAGTR